MQKKRRIKTPPKPRPKAKKKDTKKKKRHSGEDTHQRKKFRRGGRIEGYTMGEALGKKDWA